MNHPFTSTYIEMAKAAEEIQAMRLGSLSFMQGDYYLFSGDRIERETVRLTYGEYTPNLFLPDLEPPWLPRLDQLLGMLDPTPLHFVGMISYEISTKRDPYWQRFTEWHELALAVVMREKHSKVWKDGAWAKA